MLRNIFRTYDLDNSGAISINELAGLLAYLKVEYEARELKAIMDEIDKNNSGYLEFEEFSQFLLYNPYK